MKFQILICITATFFCTPAFAQSSFASFVTVKHDDGDLNFWWEAKQVNPTILDQYLARTATEQKLELQFTKTLSTVSRIYRTPDLSENNALNLAKTFGVSRFFLGDVVSTPIEKIVGLNGIYIRADLAWIDGNGKRELKIERAVFDRDESIALTKAIAEIGDVMLAFAKQEVFATRAKVGLEFGNNDVVFESVSGRDFVSILGQLEKAGMSGTVVWASGGKVVVRFSKSIDVALKAVALREGEIDSTHVAGQPLRIKTR